MHMATRTHTPRALPRALPSRGRSLPCHGQGGGRQGHHHVGKRGVSLSYAVRMASRLLAPSSLPAPPERSQGTRPGRSRWGERGEVGEGRRPKGPPTPTVAPQATSEPRGKEKGGRRGHAGHPLLSLSLGEGTHTTECKNGESGRGKIQRVIFVCSLAPLRVPPSLGGAQRPTPHGPRGPHHRTPGRPPTPCLHRAPRRAWFSLGRCRSHRTATRGKILRGQTVVNSKNWGGEGRKNIPGGVRCKGHTQQQRHKTIGPRHVFLFWGKGDGSTWECTRWTRQNAMHMAHSIPFATPKTHPHPKPRPHHQQPQGNGSINQSINCCCRLFLSRWVFISILSSNPLSRPHT